MKKNAKAMAIKATKTHIILLSLAKPNGIKPIKPPTATFVSLVLELLNAPKKTSIKPMRITKKPVLIKL